MYTKRVKKSVAVVLCAGKGIRLGKEYDRVAKAMIPILGKPLIKHVIDYWSPSVSRFVIVVGHHKKQVMKYISTIPVKVNFVEQKNPHGIADAVNRVIQVVPEKFIVILGDCLCVGEFKFPVRMEQGVGVWKTDNRQDIRQSYSIRIQGHRIVGVKEKPRHIFNNFCGMGYYFFTDKVFSYIKKTKPSSLRGEVEITDVIQKMIDGGEKISPVLFKGEYINITHSEDIARAEEMLRRWGR